MSANNTIVFVPASESMDPSVNSVSPSAIIGDVDAPVVSRKSNRTPANTASPAWGDACDEPTIVPVKNISARSTPVNEGPRTRDLFLAHENTIFAHENRIFALENQVRDLTNSHNALLAQFHFLIEKLNANVTQPTMPAPTNTANVPVIERARASKPTVSDPASAPTNTTNVPVIERARAPKPTGSVPASAPTNTANVSVIERARASKPTVSVPPPPAVQPQKKPIDVKFLTCVRNSLAKMSQDQRDVFDVSAVPPIKDGKSIEQILTDLGHPHTIKRLAHLQNKEGNLIAFNATYLIIDQLIGNISLSDTQLVAMLQ